VSSDAELRAVSDARLAGIARLLELPRAGADNRSAGDTAGWLECVQASISGGQRPVFDGAFRLARDCGPGGARWYSPSEACDVVARSGVLVMTGDSLTRQLAQALLTVMVGNYYNATELRADRALQGREGIPR
jgi:hypothetical protein